MESAITTITLDQFDDSHLNGLTPVLIRDGLRDWKAFRTWTPQHLRELCAARTVDYHTSVTGSFRRNPDGSALDPEGLTLWENRRFDEATTRIIESERAGPKVYISHQHIRQKLPELAADVQSWRPAQVRGPFLWFGSAGITTPLHHDVGVNIFAQVYGRKEFSLFSPDQSDNLYPYPEDCKMANLSSVDLRNPDTERFPKFLNARKLQVQMEAGEVLVLPSFWWHEVTSASISISVNQWVAPALRQCRGASAFRFLRNSWQTYQAWSGFSSLELLNSALSLSEEHPTVAVLSSWSALGNPDGSLDGLDPARVADARTTLEELLQEVSPAGEASGSSVAVMKSSLATLSRSLTGDADANSSSV